MSSPNGLEKPKRPIITMVNKEGSIDFDEEHEPIIKSTVTQGHQGGDIICRIFTIHDPQVSTNP